MDYLDAILYEQPMVKDGLDMEQRIKAELNKGSRLIDISGTMDYQDGDTINSTCLRNSKQGNRDYYVVSVLIPSANSSEIEKLGRRIGGMIGGGSKCLLVVNQYNQEYVFLEDDASRHTPNNEETQYISYLKYDNFFKSGVSISDMIDRYNYVTMSKGERALAFLGNQDPFEPFCTFIPIALIVSLIVLAIVSHRKFGVKEAMGARHYVINGSFAVTHKKKTKGEVSVSTVYVPPSSSGGGSRRGSSGRSHSGGSGGW